MVASSSIKHRMRLTIVSYGYRVWQNGTTCTVEAVEEYNGARKTLQVCIAPDKSTAESIIYHLNIALDAMKRANEELVAGTRLAEANAH